MNSFEFSPLAEAEFLALIQEIAEHRPRVALKVKARIERGLELLATMPTLGGRHPTSAAPTCACGPSTTT